MHERISCYPSEPLLFFLMHCQPPSSTLFPYTTLFRSETQSRGDDSHVLHTAVSKQPFEVLLQDHQEPCHKNGSSAKRSEEHTSELQSHVNLVCRLLLEKKNKITQLADLQSYHHTSQTY